LSGGPSDILIAGAGIAGLTAALAFAQRGFSVRLFERAPELAEVGAGLQLSPNATRLLDSLGLAAALRQAAVRPEAIVLRRASTSREIARVPLGAAGTRRWGADYLVIHRADLQSVLLEAVKTHPAIRLDLGLAIEKVRQHAGGVTVSVGDGTCTSETEGRLLIGADGVWSRLRGQIGGPSCQSSGHTAWRTVIARDAPGTAALDRDMVTAFLDPRFHVVAYPLRGGRDLNLVAITRDRPGGVRAPDEWAVDGDPTALRSAMAGTGNLLRGLVDAADDWTAWPLMQVAGEASWHTGRVVLIGDAAHAMTPHAAQGAGMAIEDAVVLAALVAAAGDGLEPDLARFEAERRPRVERVRRRGRFNRFVWHAWGPVALGRDLVLGMRSPDKVAADFDWLYGWKPEAWHE